LARYKGEFRSGLWNFSAWCLVGGGVAVKSFPTVIPPSLYSPKYTDFAPTNPQDANEISKTCTISFTKR
jgi:hypothetical protein